MHWLYPANIKHYDVLSAFSQKESYWPMKSKVSVGDKLYLYLSAPYKQIAFVCEITKTDIPETVAMPKVKPFFKSPPTSSSNKYAFMRLENIMSLPLGDESLLGLIELRKNGLNGMIMGPRKLENNECLLEYIKSVQEC